MQIDKNNFERIGNTAYEIALDHGEVEIYISNDFDIYVFQAGVEQNFPIELTLLAKYTARDIMLAPRFQTRIYNLARKFEENK